MPCGPEVSAFIDGLTEGTYPIMVFQTGAGANALFDEADRLDRLDELVSALLRIIVVARGPKPGAALGQRGIRPSVYTREPHTTADLVEAMAGLDIEGRCVGLLHYGERNDLLADRLERRGARLEELQVYQWMMPEDVEPLRVLVREIVAGRVEALAFTTQVQARHLFRIAEEMGRATCLARALNATTVVASVGPTCTAVLRTLGVTPRVEPERPKMRPLVTALAEYLERQRESGSPSGRPPVA